MKHKIAVLALVCSFLSPGCSSDINNISPKEAATLQSENKAVIIDVREDSEWKEKHIPGAIHIPLNQLTTRMAELEPYKNSKIITQCKSGGRSAKAYETLKSSGFNNTFNMSGGLDAWKKEGLSVE